MIDRLPAGYGPAILIFVAVGLAVLSLALMWEWWRDRRQRKEVTQRLESMASGAPGPDAFGDLFRDTKLSEVTWMEPLVARLPHTRDLQHLLEQADVPWRVGTFFLLTVGAAVAMAPVVHRYRGRRLRRVAALHLRQAAQGEAPRGIRRALPGGDRPVGARDSRRARVFHRSPDGGR